MWNLQELCALQDVKFGTQDGVSPCEANMLAEWHPCALPV